MRFRTRENAFTGYGRDFGRDNFPRFLPSKCIPALPKMGLPGMGTISKLAHTVLNVHIIMRIPQDKVGIWPGGRTARLSRVKMWVQFPHVAF